MTKTKTEPARQWPMTETDFNAIMTKVLGVAALGKS